MESSKEFISAIVALDTGESGTTFCFQSDSAKDALPMRLMSLQYPADMTAEVFQFAHLRGALACGAALVERSARIVHVNPRAAAMLGPAPAQLVGQP
jgi:PAS domain-containing protein